MIKEFVPYELAVKLKAIGFNEECFGAYHNENYLDLESEEYDYSYAVKAPIFSQAFRWFREKYDMSGEINSYYSDKKWSFNYDIVTIYKEKASDRFDAYEEAELACLERLIAIVESKQQEQ